MTGAPAAPGPRRDRVAVLCTANRCRSPLAAAILRREIAARRLPVDVASAGILDPGQPATPRTVEVATRLGLDLRPHVSRVIDSELLVGADLVVGMERLHVREAVLMEPSVWPHAFTLPELVRRAELVAPREPDLSLRAWLEILSVGRNRLAMMGAAPDDEIRDPTSDASVDHESTAAELEDLVERLLSRAWPS